MKTIFLTLKRFWKYLRWLFLPLCAAGLYWYIWIWNPLPSDERMIENFQKNRADFAEAVRRYREYPRQQGVDSSMWYLEGDTLEVYQRAGISHISYTVGPIWQPDPYSMATLMKSEALTGYAGLAAQHRYGGLRLKPATTPQIDHPMQTDDSSYRRNSLFFGTYWKEYYFFPEAPHIVDGYLLWPPQIVGKDHPGAQYHEKEGIATSQIKRRVLASLSRMPSKWKRFHCVYRQIEPQWFLGMCNG